MTLSVKDILLSNLDQVTDKDGLYQPSDALLDLIWDHIISTTTNKGLLMSDVINGDTDIDRYLVDFARTGTIEDAAKLRERAQDLFRTHAYNEVEQYEYDVMAAINAPPEPEPEPEFDDGLPF